MKDFKQNISEFNKQLSFNSIQFSNLNKLKGGKVDAVIIIGMGGSGQVGDIIAGLKNELNITVPVLVWKNYNLPENQFKNPLYIFISFSGNTEETLSGFGEAYNKAVVCSGGKLLKIAKAENAPIALFENPGMQPRQGGGFMFYGAMGILRTVFPEIKMETAVLKNSDKDAKKIAKKIKDRIILIYSSQKNNFISYNWKTRLNETAKIPAFCGIIPEICHNEIEIFENKKFSNKILVILIKDESDTKLIKNKMKKLEKLFKNNKINSLILEIRSKNKMERLWNSLLLADWVGYYLAKINKLNPLKTALIDQLKSTK